MLARLGRYRGWAVPLVPALAMLVVGGVGSGDRQLWEDEHATWHAATLPYDDFVRLIGHVDLALAPYYVLMQGWIFAFGDSPVTLRAPSVIAMALTAGMVALLGRRLFGARVGLLAGLLFAAVPSMSRYAQEARPYAIAMLLSVLAAVLLTRAIDQPTWPRWLTYGGCMVALGLAHLVALSVLIAHVLAVRFTASVTGRLRVWRWLGALVLVAAAAGPFVLAASRSSDAVSWIRIDQPTLRAFPAELFGSPVVAALTVVFAVTGVYAYIRGPEPHVTLLASWALAPPVLTFLTFPILGLFHFRYLLFTIPAWVILGAAGLDAFAGRLVASLRARSARPRRRGSARVIIAGAAAAVIGLAGLPGQVSARHDPVLGYPDYRQAAELIRSDLRIGDAIAFGGIHFRARRAMTYENRRTLRPRDVFLYEPAERLGGYVATECPDPAACLGGTARIWLVNTTLSVDYFAELPPAIGDLLRNRCTVERTWHLEHLHLVLLRVDGAAPPAG